MGFMSWLKDTFSSEEEINLEEFSKDKLANEKWLEHYFRIAFTRLSKESDDEFSLRVYKLKQEILGVVMGQLVNSDSHKIDKDTMIFKGSLRKSVTIKDIEEQKGNYYFLIRFSDYNEKDFKKIKGEGMLQREKKNGKKEDYQFTPLQSWIALRILPAIEFGLVGIFKIEPHENMTWLKFDGKEPIVQQFNGLQYFSYPIAKRIELHKKYPEVDKELFGWEFNNFINWVMEKRNANEHMRKYCKAVDKLLESSKSSSQ